MYSKTTLLVILSAIVGSSLSLPTPPPVGKTASRARYAVNNAGNYQSYLFYVQNIVSYFVI